jgi:ABC-type branched-subunit amino acid transport system substrate-binding protein
VADADGVTLAGGTVVKTVTSSIGSPDTAAAAQVVSAHPQGVGCACNQGGAARLLKSLRQAGYAGPFAASEATVIQSDIPTLGSLASNLWLAGNVHQAGDPQAAQYLAEMKGHGTAGYVDNVAADAWLAVHAIAQVLAGKPDVTAASLVSALKSATIDTGGFAGPAFSFAATGPIKDAPRIANTNVLIFTVKSGRLVEQTGQFVNPING